MAPASVVHALAGPRDDGPEEGPTLARSSVKRRPPLKALAKPSPRDSAPGTPAAVAESQARVRQLGNPRWHGQGARLLLPSSSTTGLQDAKKVKHQDQNARKSHHISLDIATTQAVEHFQQGCSMHEPILNEIRVMQDLARSQIPQRKQLAFDFWGLANGLDTQAKANDAAEARSPVVDQPLEQLRRAEVLEQLTPQELTLLLGYEDMERQEEAQYERRFWRTMVPPSRAFLIDSCFAKAADAALGQLQAPRHRKQRTHRPATAAPEESPWALSAASTASGFSRKPTPMQTLPKLDFVIPSVASGDGGGEAKRRRWKASSFATQGKVGGRPLPKVATEAAEERRTEEDEEDEEDNPEASIGGAGRP